MGLQALSTPLARAAAFLARKISIEKVLLQLVEKHYVYTDIAISIYTDREMRQQKG